MKNLEQKTEGRLRTIATLRGKNAYLKSEMTPTFSDCEGFIAEIEKAMPSLGNISLRFVRKIGPKG